MGSFGVPLGAQDRILIDFRLILGPLLDPSRPQLGGLGASFGVLGRSFGGLEPFYLRSYFQVFFGLHFASISDPRTTPKSFKNQLIIRVKIKLRKRLISTPFPSKFQENVMLKTKTSIYQKCAKTCSFCKFLEHELMSTKSKNDLESDLKQHQNSFPTSLIFD